MMETALSGVHPNQHIEALTPTQKAGTDSHEGGGSFQRELEFSRTRITPADLQCFRSGDRHVVKESLSGRPHHHEVLNAV